MKFNNKEYNIAVWNGEKLSSLISFDAETEMITHESIIPELITLQIYDGSDTVTSSNRIALPSFSTSTKTQNS